MYDTMTVLSIRVVLLAGTVVLGCWYTSTLLHCYKYDHGPQSTVLYA
jgi:hypothetical protein